MDDTTRILIELAVIAVSGGLLGPRVAAEASQREKIHSDLGRMLNLISSMAVAGLLPAFIVGLILGGGRFVLPVMLTLLTTILITLVLFALTEIPLRKQAEALQPKVGEEELWTAEKARTSGL